MINFIKLFATVCILMIPANSIASNKTPSVKTTGERSPVQIIQHGGAGTISYGPSDKDFERFEAYVNKSAMEVRQSFLDCLETVRKYQKEEVAKLNIKLAEYLIKEKNLPDEKAKSWAKDILENFSIYKEF